MSKNKKIILIILSIFIVLSLFLGISYAYYIKAINQEESNVVKTKCLNVSLTNEKNDINLDEQYPIPDTEGRKLTPYQFTITNTCEQFISYSVNLESLEGTTMDSNAIKVMVNNEAPANLATLDTAQTSIDNSVESRTLVTGSLGSGDSIDYALRLWMDYGDSADLSNMNKVFNSKVVVTATIGTYKPSDYVTTLHDALLINEYGVTDVNNAISKIEAKGTPDFSQTAPLVTWLEQIGNETTLEIYKPAESSINIDTLTSKLSNNDSLLWFYTDVQPNIQAGKFSSSNGIYNDPTTLRYDSDIEYYIVSEVTSIDNNGHLCTSYGIPTASKIIYKVISASKVDSTSNWNNKNYASVKYILKVIPIYIVQNDSDKSDKGLYSMKDDYGTSYYYRGNVLNNNVYFAGFYWNIIRINGDNSIRLLYSGAKGSIDSNSYTTTYFNEKGDNPAYIGYMYGTSSGAIGTREYNISNGINSNVKNAVDTFYQNVIIKNGLEKYISDSGFCGDRSILNGDGYSTTTTTNFNAIERLLNNKTPILTCPDKEHDFYTTLSSSIGNKALKYPVGLITADETLLGGIVNGKISTGSYLRSSVWYWTMTPLSSSTGYTVGKDDNASFRTSITGNYGVRPVINLKADVEISGGTGTINDPFVIKTT